MPRPSLKTLSDKELLSRVNALVTIERETTLDVVQHLGELDRRKLYLNLGYGTLFDYCTRHLKYSASSAGRRIQAARCVRRFPEVGERLKDGRVNLCTLSLVTGILSDDNKDGLLARISNKSYREVEAMTAAYRPRPAIRDRVRTVCVAVAAPPKQQEPTSTPNVGSRSPASLPERQIQASTPNVGSGAARAVPLPRPRIEKKVLIQFTADPAFMNKLEEARSLLSHKLGPNAAFADIFDAALEVFLDKHSPTRRQKRRAARTTAAQKHSKNPRRISQPIRDQVFQRYQDQCTYVSPTGRRCQSTRTLQVDHIVPVARGGTNAPSNLRLLCASHNKLEAERVLGRDATGGYWRRE